MNQSIFYRAMRWLVLAALSALFIPPQAAHGQGNVIMFRFAGAPTGSCSFIMEAINTTNGDFYVCNPNGTWFKVTGTTSPGVASVYGSTGTITTLASPVFTGTITGAAATLSSTLTLSSLAGGGNQCLRVTNAGVVQATGSDCGSGGGGGGSPGGSSNSVQFNSAGTFGGDTAFTYNGSTVTVPAGVAGTSYGLALGTTGAGLVGVGGAGSISIIAGTANAPQVLFKGGAAGNSTAGTLVLNTSGGFPNFGIQAASNSLGISCAQTSTNTQGSCIMAGGRNNFTGTAGTSVVFGIGTDGSHSSGATFAPTSGSAGFRLLDLAAVINQTGSSSGSYDFIRGAVTETSLKNATNNLIHLLAGASGTTDMFIVNNSGVTSLGGLKFPATSPDVGITRASAGTLFLDNGTGSGTGGNLELNNIVIHGTCTGCGGGGGGSAEHQINGVDTLSQTLINFQNSASITATNVSAGNIQFSLTNAANYVITNPTTDQKIVQPPTTKFSANNYDNTVTVSDIYRWLQSAVSGTLTAGSPATITLPAGIRGIDVSGNAIMGGPRGGMMIAISGDANPEAVYVTGGTYTYASGGTVVFTPFFSHTSGAYNLGSSTAGGQEALNDSCGMSTTASANGNCHIIFPPTPGSSWTFTGTLYIHATHAWIDGKGSTLTCNTRGPCIQNGNQSNSNNWNSNVVSGFKFIPVDRSSDPTFAGCAITGYNRTSGTITVTTTTGCTFRTGDMVSQMLTDRLALRGDIPSITVSDATHYTYTRSGASDIPAETSPGFAAVNYVAILDNGTGSSFPDLVMNASGNADFVHFMDYWDDEASNIDNWQMSGGVQSSATWMGYVVYSGGANNLPNTAQQLAPVISMKGSSFTNLSCFKVENSNGVYVRDTVCQNSISQFAINSTTGNFQSAFLENIYPEASAAVTNPSGASPFGGGGVSGLLGGGTSDNYHLRGEMGLSGQLPTYGASGSLYTLASIIAHDTTAGTATSPLPCAFLRQTTAGSTTFSCPRINNGPDTITYDVILQSGLASATFPSPSPATSNCTGGSPTACGSAIVGQAQGTGLMQSFTVDTSANTTAIVIGNGAFQASPHFWPGGAVMTQNALDSDKSIYAFGIAFNGGVVVMSPDCGSGGVNWGGYTSCYNTTTTVANSLANTTAMLLWEGGSSGGGMTTNARGRIQIINAAGTVSFPAHHYIDLVNSTPGDTKATANYRSIAAATDVYLGSDNTSNQTVTNMPLSMGSPVSISAYINNVGDGTSWKWRQTATLFTHASPVTFLSGNAITFGGITGSTQCLQVNSSGILSGTGSGCGGAGSSPGGAVSNVQFNNTTFGGNSGFVYDGTSIVGIGPVDGTNDGALQLKGRTSGVATLSATATGGTLNLGSTNATVDPSGNLTVASCTGCGGGGSSSWSGITNPGGNLTLSMASFTTTFNQAASVPWTWGNTTAATVTVPQPAPSHVWSSQYWTGSATGTDTITLVPVMTAGANGRVVLGLSHSGSTGSFSLDVPAGSGSNPSITFGTAGLGIASTSTNNITFAANNGTVNVALSNNGTGVASWGRTTVSSINGINFSASENNSMMALHVSCNSCSNSTIPLFNFGGNPNGTASTLNATTGTQTFFSVGYTSLANGQVSFQPTSGSANYVHMSLAPIINQTSTSSGNYAALQIKVTETSLKGSDNRLLDLWSGATANVNVLAIDNLGKFKLYNGITTGGFGIPVQVAAVNSPTQSSAIGATTIYTVGSQTSNFDLKAGVQCTTVNSGSTVTLTVTYTDTSNTLQTITSPIASCAALGSSAIAYIAQPIRAKNGTTIQYSTSIANTPTYDVFVDAYQLN